ncbi:peptide ABC transporter permease [Halorubrum aidingense JCM 13560]|uniref:Peptide ABC transporter permease n=1 Tax=Halorubrum aidingense JCM 13560 TaxID=1230454 RepID=M0PCR9_9EURY|nr:ABC transporter permease [Halorubrum aidingense]EMA67658.1 peptide ABC transporter permease [Halorubrum aidingense JCM 13560]
MSSERFSISDERKAHYGRFIRQFRRNQKAMIGLGIVVSLFVIAIVTSLFPEIVPYDPGATNVPNREAAPSLSHPMGTDELGRDVFSRVVLGTQISLYVGFTSISAAMVMGTSIGIVAGYYQGLTDEALMRAMDAMMSFPPILLALTIVAVMEPSLNNVIIALALVYTPFIARVARSAALSVRNESYIEAAEARGESDLYIIFREVLPNCVGPLLVQGSINIAFTMLLEASLSFLGLGVQPPEPSWGLMINSGWAYMGDAPWMVFFPAAAIATAVIGFNLLGDGLRDVLDPKGEIIE